MIRSSPILWCFLAIHSRSSAWATSKRGVRLTGAGSGRRDAPGSTRGRTSSSNRRGRGGRAQTGALEPIVATNLELRHRLRSVCRSGLRARSEPAPSGRVSHAHHCGRIRFGGKRNGGLMTPHGSRRSFRFSTRLLIDILFAALSLTLIVGVSVLTLHRHSTPKMLAAAPIAVQGSLAH